MNRRPAQALIARMQARVNDQRKSPEGDSWIIKRLTADQLDELYAWVSSFQVIARLADEGCKIDGAAINDAL